MRHYFFVETEEELNPQDRGDMILAFDRVLKESKMPYTIKSTGYKVNNPSGTAMLVNIREII